MSGNFGYDPYTPEKTFGEKAAAVGLWASISIGMMLLAILISIPVILFNGFILSIVWNWFIPSIFDGAPVLSIWEAIAITFVVDAFIRIPAKEKKKDATRSELVLLVLSPILTGLGILGFSAILYAIAF